MKKNSNGDVESVMMTDTASVCIRAISKIPIDSFEGVACLGSLPYLNSILNSSQMEHKDATIEFNYENTESGKKFLKSLMFSC